MKTSLTSGSSNLPACSVPKCPKLAIKVCFLPEKTAQAFNHGKLGRMLFKTNRGKGVKGKINYFYDEK